MAAGNENHGGQLVSAFSGPHRFGAMGTAVFREGNGRRSGYFQTWFLSNGYDIIYVIYESQLVPNDHELSEAQTIIEDLDLE